MNILQIKIKKTHEVIIDASKKFPQKKIVVAWTGGKDSTVLLHIIRTLYDNTIPFPVMFNDSTIEFPEIYTFIKKITKEWNINLIVVPHAKTDLLKFNRCTTEPEKMKLSRIMKIHAMNAFIKKFKPVAFMSGIRWDEHESRSKEQYFSQRKDHIRIHPLLHFTEKDIWEYIHTLHVPYVSLYDQGYRSLGEQPFTKKAKIGEGERSGREQSKEIVMEKLRQMGYW